MSERLSSEDISSHFQGGTKGTGMTSGTSHGFKSQAARPATGDKRKDFFRMITSKRQDSFYQSELAEI